MLRENLQILFSLSILFISTNSLHLNNRGSGGISIDKIGLGNNNIVGSSTSDNNIDDITDDTHSYRRSQISSTSNLDYIVDPRLNNRILIGEHLKKLPISGGGGGGGNGIDGIPDGSNGIVEPKYKLFDDNFMKFNHIKSINSTPSRHYNFGYIRNLDNVIPDIDDDIDSIDDNNYINNYHHRPILIGLNQQQHYHPKHNHQYGNIPIFNGDSSEILLRNNEFQPLTNFNRKPPLALSSSSSILHNIPPLPKYAMINGNRNRYEHDNYGYKLDDKLPKKYSNNDDLIDIDSNRNDNNDDNNDDDDDDGMINDEPYDYRKRRNYKNKKNNNQSPPKALQELFQQNGVDSSSISNSNSKINSDHGKNGNNVNSREAPLDIRKQTKQPTKIRQEQQQRQTKKQLKQNENKQKKLLQMEQLKQIKRSGSSGVQSPQMMPPSSHSIASQLMLRTARGQRQYDVPQIECPSAMDGMERFACPTPDRQGRYRCIDDHVLCDGFIDCPEGEDEDRSSCMFYKTTKAHLDVLADALLRWARGR